MADTAARLSEDWLGWVSSKGKVDDCYFFLLLLGSSYEDICGGVDKEVWKMQQDLVQEGES